MATPIAPMLAKAVALIPRGAYLYEPKWDGFRALVFRGKGDEVYMQSREEKPLDRYFPELHTALGALPERCVVDGEIVMPTPHGLDFDALQQRLHPAGSRVARLSISTPASFVAFDLLAQGAKDLRALPQHERRLRLEAAMRTTAPPLYLTPMTRDYTTAVDWLARFEGAGLDGVVAKSEAGAYEPGRRVMLKVKHVRTAECVVAGLRWHKTGHDAVGSLLLGLHDDHGVLHHVGVTSAFTMERRRALAKELAPLRARALRNHPWRAERGEERRVPGQTSRWSGGKDLSWVPLRPERVCEVKYDHLQGDRFRHATVFVRWRDDKAPEACRYDQLEVTPPFELAKVFRPRRR